LRRAARREHETTDKTDDASEKAHFSTPSRSNANEAIDYN
jgi:hypothetical protein